jgi:hypothetical protein
MTETPVREHPGFHPIDRLTQFVQIAKDLVQSLNLGPIWQASDSLSPRAPGSARRPFLKFAPEPSCGGKISTGKNN